MKKRVFYTMASTLIFFLFLTSCAHYEKHQVKVDFSDSTMQVSKSVSDSITPIYVAIASMTSPRETFIYYHDLINFISKKIGHPVYIKEKKTYEEVNNMLATGEVSFAFICSGAYINAKQKNEAKLLVAPVINRQTYYQAYIITQKNSGINTFGELKGHSFAFTDPISNTGFMYPEKQIRKLGLDVDTFFSKTIYTYGHDISIQMVNKGIIDAASVHSLIYQYIARKYPKRVENIKIIKKSELFGMPPVVTPLKLKNKCYHKLKNIFLTIDRDSAGRVILNNLGIEKFVMVDDSIYNNVRKLKK